MYLNPYNSNFSNVHASGIGIRISKSGLHSEERVKDISGTRSSLPISSIRESVKSSAEVLFYGADRKELMSKQNEFMTKQSKKLSMYHIKK